MDNTHHNSVLSTVARLQEEVRSEKPPPRVIFCQVVTAVQPCSELPLYDKLLPWLAGAPLEHAAWRGS